MSAVKRWHVVLVALVMLLMGLAYPAEGADEPTAAEVEAATMDRMVTNVTATPIGTVITPQGVLQSRTATATVTAYNGADQVLWTYSNTRMWTFNGVRVVSAPKFTTKPVIYSLLWDYQGATHSNDYWLDCSSTHNHGHACHYRYKQGKFVFCVTDLGCTQTVLPWTEITAKWNGGYAADGTD
jgi:hypothetical protein